MKLVLLVASILMVMPAISQPISIRIENPSGFIRKDEPVEISREALLNYFGQIDSLQVVKISSSSGIEIPSQCDDLNLDGIWDEFAFVYSFDEYETADFFLYRLHKDSLPSYQKRTNCRIAVSREKNGIYIPVSYELRPKDHLPQSRPMLYQFEGPGWENELVAFRSYFDSRNGKDIFGKQENALVLDTIGLPESDYHHLTSWGMDILKVGNSLGAGALGMYESETLVRLGETEKAEVQIIANGPVRSCIRLSYTGWQVGNDKINLQEDITIWAGKYWYKSKVSVSGLPGKGELLVGIVNLKNKKKQKNTIKLNPPFRCLLTYSRQTERDDNLGMGILFPSSEFISFGEASANASNEEIGNTFYVRLKISESQPALFYFFSCWEKSAEAFRTKEGVISEIEQQADRLYIPLKITIN